LRKPAVALVVALLASLGAFSPALPVTRVPAAAAITPAEAKVVIIVGATHGATGNYRSIADEAYAEAIKYTPNVVKVYSPYATWDAVKAAIQGASVVIYLGHGNGFPSPYRTTPWPYSQNGFGLNAAAGQGDNNTQYYGEYYIANEVQLAPNAVVILNHLCYASGNSEPGYPLPTLGVAQQRVDNFAAGFLRAGARAVIAEAHGSIVPYIRGLFATHATVEEVWKSSSGYHGNDYRFGSARTPGYEAIMDPDGTTGGYYRSIVGHLALRTEDVTGVPYVDTSLDPTAFVAPGAASVGVDGTPIYWDQGLTGQFGTLPLDLRVRVNEIVGGDGVTPLTLRVRALDGSVAGWVAGNQLVARDSAGPEFWGLDGFALLSPNGDGEHDVLNLQGRLSESAAWRFRILDSTGGVLVETTGSSNVATLAWDGLVGGVLAQDGLYTWSLRAEDSWGNDALRTSGAFIIDHKPELRHAGADRYATAAAISAANYAPGVAVAYVATGTNFPDALAGAAVAGNLGGPLLLVTRDTIPAATATELARLQPVKIVILGAAGVVGDSVAAALAGFATSTMVYRHAGADRYATAAAISAANYAPGVAVAYVATGTNFPDALAGAAVAGNLGGPLLLVTRDTIPAATAAELARLAPERIVILGSTGVVSANVGLALGAYETD
jgi:hypothetical protein